MRHLFRTGLWLALAASALAACPPSNGGNDGGGADGGACDSFSTEHERLLNAPTGSTVVKKTPAIPDGAFP